MKVKIILVIATRSVLSVSAESQLQEVVSVKLVPYDIAVQLNAISYQCTVLFLIIAKCVNRVSQKILTSFGK